MASNIPPKPRLTPSQLFYTRGESPSRITPSSFKAHSAEPGEAASILQRNSLNRGVSATKSKVPVLRSSGYSPGLFSNRYDLPLPSSTTNQKIASLTEACRPSEICAKTVTSSEFSAKSNPKIPVSSIPVTENWLYRTHSKPVAKDKSCGALDYSVEGPDWFKIAESKNVQEHDITKSLGFDGTVTMLSRISGWITVSPRSRNRQKRLGRYGPFDKSKKGNDFQNVSDLAPAWMQNEGERKKDKKFVNALPPSFVRNEPKRMILVDKEQPEKCVFALGDYRHNVSTKEEAEIYARGTSENYKRLFEWKEDVAKQKYDKPVTGKIGSIY